MTHCAATRHDTASAYKAGCRCPAARRATARAQKIYRLRSQHGQRRLTIDSTGTRRRIQALAVLGWRAQDIGDRIGTTSRGVSLILGRTTVQVRTAERVAAVYDQLADHCGPSRETARRAAAKGWLQPLWWDDDTIDDPDFDPLTAYQDDPSTRSTTTSDAATAVRDLTRKGWSATEIAARLGCSQRRVVRIRARLRATQAPDRSESQSTLAPMQVAS